MNDILFFSPTSKYKEMLLLEHIEKDNQTTQSEISQLIDSSLGMVNKYIENLEEKKYLVREYKSAKTVLYRITPEGVKRKKYLQVRYIKELMDHNIKSSNIAYNFLEFISQKAFNEVYFYGAGEVAELLLKILKSNQLELSIVGILDDDIEKQGCMIQGVEVFTPKILETDMVRGVIITSYTYEEDILKKLKVMKYPQNKIIKYFNMEEVDEL